MPAKHFDLNLDELLGNESASDYYIPSQKAIKTYVDKKFDQISTISNLQNLQDVNISNPQNLQILTYNADTQKWINDNFSIQWGSIQGTITNQNDLKLILDSKANIQDIPKVSDTYSESSSDAMSGKAVASALSSIPKTTITFRSW